MMENTELIKALRKCGKASADRCWKCGYYDREPWCEAALANDAAAALEAADIKIADYTAAVEALDDSNDAYIKENERLKKRIAELIPKEGEWIDEQRGRWIYAKCNLCGKVQDVRSNFCPNCGAKMRKGDK